MTLVAKSRSNADDEHARTGGRSWRQSIPGLVVLGVSAVMGGILGVALIAVQDSQSVSAERHEVDALPASVQVFDGRKTVELTFAMGDRTELFLPRGGLVTSLAVAPGSSVESGAVVMSIDENPIVALATTRPLYRDLAVGDRGEDVRALQDALADLGYLEASADGRFGASTRAALRALNKDRGVAGVDLGRFAHEFYLWVPTTAFRVDEVSVAVGSTVEGGAVLATQSGSIERIAAGIPEGYPAAGHALELDVFGTVAPLDASGVVTDPAALRAVSVSAEFQRYSAVEDGLVGQTGELRYVEPVELLRVPPSALYAISGDTACLSADGESHVATIVYSAMGGTLVDTGAWRPDQVDVGDAIDLGAC